MPSRAGQLLIASAQLGDPNFFHTVVLLVQDDDEHGSLGLVLNRPTSATVKEACEDDLSIACPVDAPLFKGGPCEGLLTVLHTREDVGDLEVMNGVYFTSHFSPATGAEACRGGSPPAGGPSSGLPAGRVVELPSVMTVSVVSATDDSPFLP